MSMSKRRNEWRFRELRPLENMMGRGLFFWTGKKMTTPGQTKIDWTIYRKGRTTSSILVLVYRNMSCYPIERQESR